MVATASLKHLDDTEVASRLAVQLIMVNVKKRKGRVVIDSDSEDSASDDNLDQVGTHFSDFDTCDRVLSCQQFEVKLMYAN